jgi:hypothetical protein
MCDVAQTVRLVSMYGFVIVPEGCFEALGPDTIELAEVLADEAVESGVGAFLGATFDNHVCHFNLWEGVL